MGSESRTYLLLWLAMFHPVRTFNLTLTERCLGEHFETRQTNSPHRALWLCAAGEILLDQQAEGSPALPRGSRATPSGTPVQLQLPRRLMD